jgi:cobyric acid synthase
LIGGTGSDVGKSVVVAGFCRLLARQGIKVAPFKGQNMSLNSAVTADGGEIGRAQAAQAHAAGVAPERAMNPVLIKPTAEDHAQVIVMGAVECETDAREYSCSSRGCCRACSMRIAICALVSTSWFAKEREASRSSTFDPTTS